VGFPVWGAGGVEGTNEGGDAGEGEEEDAGDSVVAADSVAGAFVARNGVATIAVSDTPLNGGHPWSIPHVTNKTTPAATNPK